LEEEEVVVDIRGEDEEEDVDGDVVEGKGDEEKICSMWRGWEWK